MKKRSLVSSLVSLLMFSTSAFADRELTGPECMSGFNATLAKVRAIQRADSCSKSGGLNDCRVQMGLGVLAIGATTARYGKDLGEKVAGTIRDLSARPCPYVASRESGFSLLFFESAVAAGCTPQLEIDRARIQKSMEIVEQELLLRKQQAQETLAAMEKISSDVGSASGPDRVAKIKSAIDKSTTASLQAFGETQRELNTARGPQYQTLSGDKAEYGHLKDQKFAELKKMMRNWLALPLDDTPYNYDEITKRLGPEQRQQLLDTRKAMLDAHQKEYLAARHLKDIDERPEVKRLAARADGLGTQTSRLRSLSSDPEQFVQKLESTTKELRTSIDGLSKAENALADFKAASKLATTTTDLWALASRLKNFIPSETLLDPAKTAVSSALKEAAYVAQRLAGTGAKLTEPIASMLSKYPAIAEIAAGGRAVGSLVIRGVALTGGALFTGLTFAANDMGPNNCSDVTKSKIFPRDPKNGCSQDLSPGSEIASRIFEMEPTAMCQLMKENPEVRSMVDMNYDQSYPNTRAQCGNPMTFAIEGRGQVRFDGKTATILRPGDSRETIVQFDENGVESAIKFPRMIRGGGWETLKPGDSPIVGAGDRFDRFTRDYRTQILPMIAEAGACCSGEGVTPTASECSRYGINTASGMTNTRSGTGSGGTGTTRK